MEQPIWNFEQEPYQEPYDETGYNLRAYFDRMDDADFTSDETLLVPCCERDIDLEEYRPALVGA